MKPAVKVPNVFCNTTARYARALSDMKNVEVFGHECGLFCHDALESRKPREMIAIDIVDSRFTHISVTFVSESVVHGLPYFWGLDFEKFLQQPERR